jgi:hypothetical protein
LIAGPHDELYFNITNAKFTDDERKHFDRDIFYRGDYDYDMYFINEQNEIIHGAYVDFEVRLDRFDEYRMDYSDLMYTICINIFPRKRSD